MSNQKIKSHEKLITRLFWRGYFSYNDTIVSF